MKHYLFEAMKSLCDINDYAVNACVAILRMLAPDKDVAVSTRSRGDDFRLAADAGDYVINLTIDKRSGSGVPTND